jgi:hypothetical protein
MKDCWTEGGNQFRPATTNTPNGIGSGVPAVTSSTDTLLRTGGACAMTTMMNSHHLIAAKPPAYNVT